jgi:hypothetical protein
MNKESASKVAQVLRDTQESLLLLAAERDKLAAENAAYKRHDEALKVAMVLHDKGIDRDIPIEDLTGRLEKEAEAGRLPEIARAAEMIGPNMSFGSTNNHDEGSAQSNDVLTNYLMGSVG